jgi:isoleucyl-tRNA synthetase
VPIPIFYCEGCGKHIINDDTVQSVMRVFETEGSNAWWARPAAELLPSGFKCPHCAHGSFRKETDTMDVWFDSGSSHNAVLTQRPELQWPAEMYLEGSDQHRGWFHSSLLTSVATRGTAPYRAVLTHGFVVDGDGRKMSKSLGNVIFPQEVIKQYGADVLRLWVVSADYQADIRISGEILKQLAEVYRKIRNTFRYILGNIYDFNPDTDGVAYADLPEIDRWALMRLEQVREKVTRAYDEYQFHMFYHAIHNFCTVDLSAIYFDILKDRLYASKADSSERRAAQTVLYELLVSLVTMVTPVLGFTAEEVWKHMPKRKGMPESVQLTEWPSEKKERFSEELAQKWQTLLEIRSEVTKALEVSRREKVIGNSIDASIRVDADPKTFAFLKAMETELPTYFIVSTVVLQEVVSGETSITVKVENHKGPKCERCWLHSEEGHAGVLCSRCAAVSEATGAFAGQA